MGRARLRPLSVQVITLLFPWQDAGALVCIGTENGVARFDGAAWSSLGESEGLRGKAAFAIRQADDGAMWFGHGRWIWDCTRSNGGPFGPLPDDSAVVPGLRLKLPEQPGAGVGPVILGGARGNAKGLGRLVIG